MTCCFRLHNNRFVINCQSRIQCYFFGITYEQPRQKRADELTDLPILNLYRNIDLVKIITFLLSCLYHVFIQGYLLYQIIKFLYIFFLVYKRYNLDIFE